MEQGVARGSIVWECKAAGCDAVKSSVVIDLVLLSAKEHMHSVHNTEVNVEDISADIDGSEA